MTKENTTMSVPGGSTRLGSHPQPHLAFSSPCPLRSPTPDSPSVSFESPLASLVMPPTEVPLATATSTPTLSSPDEEEASVEMPFIRRVASADVGGSHHHRRRRLVSDCFLSSISAPGNGRSSSPIISRRPSFRREVEHAAAETYLVTRLAFILLRYLGVGYRWVTRFLALACYAALLMPGFLQVGYYYFFSSQVRRSIIYGEQPRNRLDLYLPTNMDGPKPVVAFITGGAWIIGYKAWGSLLGKQLAERDVIVACIDYRNFPQGTISDMIKDASQGISFVCNNIANYGGDPSRVYVMGQSAGAHIAACALLDQAIKESGEEEDIAWSISQIKAFFGISGGYNILKLVDHFHKRGLYRSIFLSLMEGEESLQKFSPEVMLQHPCIKLAVPIMPDMILFHGTGDYSIPSNASTTFADALRKIGSTVHLILYKDKTHTDLFLQDPLRGGKDKLLQDILAIIHADDAAALIKDANALPGQRLVPELMLKLARKISPF